MRLHPVINLSSDFILESFTLHDLLVHEHLLDENLRKALLDFIVSIPDGWRVLSVVNLGASWLRTILTRCLITVTNVESEHELVGDFVQEGNVGSELGITRL